ncbi:hypothetical protein GCM10009758_32510 [Microbacterium hatanonis]
MGLRGGAGAAGAARRDAAGVGRPGAACAVPRSRRGSDCASIRRLTVRIGAVIRRNVPHFGARGEATSTAAGDEHVRPGWGGCFALPFCARAVLMDAARAQMGSTSGRNGRAGMQGQRVA